MAIDPRVEQILDEELAFRSQRPLEKEDNSYQVAGIGSKIIRKAMKAATPNTAGRKPPTPGGPRPDDLDRLLLEAEASPPPGPPVVAPPLKTGLVFPEEEAAARLATHKKRGPDVGKPNLPRTVAKAPKAKEGEQQLPDFVVGEVTFDDWIKRTETMLQPDMILAAKNWYRDTYDTFLVHLEGDVAKAKRYMQAWLVTNQNIDVAGGMQNMLLQKEQIARGVPEAEMISSGMPNPTYAARRVLQGEPIEHGVGQKISDFVDSAEQKDVRSWMGNDQEGGSPFVVDIHTARDTGLVDEALINHLERLGYDTKKINAALAAYAEANPKSKGGFDITQSPSAPKYENRARFGRELTQHLNSINWQGRSDWRSEEIQAIGWMSMLRITADKADDTADALIKNRRGISFEALPGDGSPWATKYSARFHALDPIGQIEVTRAVTNRATEMAAKISGIDLTRVVHGSGGWAEKVDATGEFITFQAPSTVTQSLSSRQGSEIYANVLGYLTQQTEVWVNTLKSTTKNPQGAAIDFLSDTPNSLLGTDVGLRKFFEVLQAADPTGLIGGYQPHRSPDGRVGMRILIKKPKGMSGATMKVKLKKATDDGGALRKALDGLSAKNEHIDLSIIEADIYIASNKWTEKPDGNEYLTRLADLLEGDRKPDLDNLRAELETIFEAALATAEGGAGPGGAGPGGAAKGQVDLLAPPETGAR